MSSKKTITLTTNEARKRVRKLVDEYVMPVHVRYSQDLRDECAKEMLKLLYDIKEIA